MPIKITRNIEAETIRYDGTKENARAIIDWLVENGQFGRYEEAYTGQPQDGNVIPETTYSFVVYVGSDSVGHTGMDVRDKDYIVLENDTVLLLTQDELVQRYPSKS